MFNETAPTKIYTLSHPGALPISDRATLRVSSTARLAGPETRVATVTLGFEQSAAREKTMAATGPDRKSTRPNPSHANISYAGICLKKKHIPVAYTSLPAYQPCYH